MNKIYPSILQDFSVYNAKDFKIRTGNLYGMQVYWRYILKLYNMHDNTCIKFAVLVK